MRNMGWPKTGLFPHLAYMAFPILPYELFILMPIPFAYFACKTSERFTVPRLITAITVWGAVYGGLVHYIALGAVLTGFPKVDKDHGICTALPPVSKSPWCALLTWHVIFAVPMGTTFLVLLGKDYKKYGLSSWAGAGHQEKFVLYWRLSLYFIVLGFSGDLPYFGELAEQGLDVFDGRGVYAGTTWAHWYHGRGVLEFLSYCSWLLFGFYFLVRAIMAKNQVAVDLAETSGDTVVDTKVIGKEESP